MKTSFWVVVICIAIMVGCGLLLNQQHNQQPAEWNTPQAGFIHCHLDGDVFKAKYLDCKGLGGVPSP